MTAGCTTDSAVSRTELRRVLRMLARAGRRGDRVQRLRGAGRDDRQLVTINLLGRERADLAARFAGPGNRFAGLCTVRAADGIPQLAEALAALHCEVHDEHPAAGDHTVVVGRVRGVRVFRGGTDLTRCRCGRAVRDDGGERPPTFPGGVDVESSCRGVSGLQVARKWRP